MRNENSDHVTSGSMLSRAKATVQRFGTAAADLLQGSKPVSVLGHRLTSTHLSLILLLLVATVPLWVDSQVVLRTMVFIGIYSILVLSMNLITGWAGQFTAAHAAFYGMGAYTSALVTTDLGWSTWAGMIAAAAITAVAGAILGVPTLRLRGPYLALATIGFSGAFLAFLLNAVWLTGGANGITGIPRPQIGSFVIKTNTGYFYFILVLLLLTIAATRRLVNSRTGRAWVALREDEPVAKQMGINTTFYKVAAFTISASIAGVMGSFFAHYMAFISPDSFTVLETITIMSMMVLGGMASIPGAILGPTLLLTIERVFSFMYNYRMIVYGAVLAGIVLLRPQGLLGPRAPVLLSVAKKRREERQMGTLLERASMASQEELDAAAVDRLVAIPRPTDAELAKRPKTLEVTGLTKSFGGLVAVDDLDFYVREGEIVSIIGPNGSGKTTVFNLLMGALTPDAGSIVLEGEELTGLPSRARVARGLGRTFQEVRLFRNMTVEENLLVAQHTRLKTGIVGALVRGRKSRQEEVLAREKVGVTLGHFADRLLPRRNDFSITLSYANRRRCEVARALATEPKLLMLDEPCAGMNPSERGEMSEIVAELRHHGYTVLLIEHHMALVMDISDRVIVLDHGSCICEGKPEEVQANEEVAVAYLGRTTED